MKIFGPWNELPPRILNLIFSPDPSIATSLKLKKYRLGLFRRMPSRGFSLMFTPGPKESN